MFNDRHRVSKRSERKREGADKKTLKSRKGKRQTESEVERVRESQRQMSPSLAPAD